MKWEKSKKIYFLNYSGKQNFLANNNVGETPPQQEA